MNCLVDDVNCLVGTYNSTYAALGFEYFCMPTLNLDDVGLNNFLSYKIYSLWAFNLKQGWSRFKQESKNIQLKHGVTCQDKMYENMNN